MNGRHLLAAAVAAAALAGGGVASAQTDEDSQTITIQVAATRTITLDTDVVEPATAFRPSDSQEIEGGTVTYSTDTPYAENASGDVLVAQRSDDPANPSADTFTIEVLASGITCSCDYGGVVADPLPADPGTQPTEITTLGQNQVITDIYETGEAGATASLTYTVTTDGAIPGSYSFTITYTIREA